MSSSQGSSSSAETRPLRKETPSSYHSVDDIVEDAPLDADAPPPPLNNFSQRDIMWILAGLWSAVFLGALGSSISLRRSVVATLLTPIGSDFNKSNQASYIGTSYLLSVCCFTPLYGRLSDILGRKGAMLLALFLFGSGTILCGLVPSMETLILARSLAGMGGGGQVFAIVVTDLIPLQRGLYQGMANILFGLGAGIGGPLGGWINDVFGWSAPLILFSVVVVGWKVNIKLPFDVQSQPLHEKLRRIDVLGSLTLVGTVGCLLLGFSLKTTEEIAWSHPLIYGLFVASFLCGLSFVLVEKYWAPFPVMPLHLMTRRTPLAVSVSNLFASVAAFSMVIKIPISPGFRLTSALLASWSHLLPHSLAIPCGSLAAGWLMRRTGKVYTLTVAAAASSLFANILVVFWNDNSSPVHLWLDIVPQGFGMASFITSTLIAMIAGVVKEDMAIATGITYLFRTTGQVLGVSLSGAILQAVLLQQLRQRIQGHGSAQVGCLTISHSASSIPHLDPVWRKAAVDSYADALRAVFLFQAAMAFLAFLCCLPIEDRPLP
ncbi:vacuolar amino acid permease [Mycena sp. CBHHK59/15]|nr:vacuolar amino acid permease [Mycena sp. CBHHK59/15]